MSKNGKIFGGGVMVGVQQCIDKVKILCGYGYGNTVSTRSHCNVRTHSLLLNVIIAASAESGIA